MGSSSSSMASNLQESIWDISKCIVGVSIGYYVASMHVIDLGIKGQNMAGPTGAIVGVAAGVAIAIAPWCGKMIWCTLRLTGYLIRKIIRSCSDFVEFLTKRIISFIEQHKPFPFNDATPPTQRRLQQSKNNQQSTSSVTGGGQQGNPNQRKNDASVNRKDDEEERDFTPDAGVGNSESLNLQELILLLEDILNSIANRTGNRNNLYLSLIKVVGRLILNFGATMEYHPNDARQNNLRLTIPGHEIIDFGSNVRNFFDEITPELRHGTLQQRATCGIYRFRCLHCTNQPFNYVGQSVNVGQRSASHLTGIRSAYTKCQITRQILQPNEVGSLLIHHAITHASQNDNFNMNDFENMFELDLVHSLPENTQLGGEDSRVRRSWEVFYQWLHRGRTADGGGNHK